MKPRGVSGLLSRWVKARRHRKVLPHLMAGWTILDVGCGLGELCRDLPDGVEFWGIDRESHFIESCRKAYPRHTFLEGDFLDILPRLPSGFDAVLLLAVLEHTPEPEAFFRAIFGLLNPGGRLFVTTPAPGSRPLHSVGTRLRLLSPMAGKDHHDFLPPERVRGLAASTGYRTLHEERFLWGLNQFFIFGRRNGVK